VSESEVSAAGNAGDGAAPLALSPEPALRPAAEIAGAGPAVAAPLALDASPAPSPLDPAVAALCAPIPDADPCGPDLDAESDAAFLDYFAAAESILPGSFFFSTDDRKPVTFFSSPDEATERARSALPGQIAALKPLMARTRDLRLLVMRARLHILSRDLSGFAVSIAAIAELLDKFWDAVHPRPQGDKLDARNAALRALDFSTVLLPLQYAPLYEARRLGSVTFRSCMIAADEVKPRPGEQKQAATALSEGLGDADPDKLAATRRSIALLKASLDRIRGAFMLRASPSAIENLPKLVDRISAFVDPLASAPAATEPDLMAGAGTESSQAGAGAQPAGAAPASLAHAKEALAAIAAYYSRLEPSSPTLPLVRQAHQLIGKSFVEVMRILVPTHLEKAAFQIGIDQVFELPIGKLAEPGSSPDGAQPADGAGPRGYNVQSRAQAVALLEQVQRFFRAAEPSSPVPMLCERARALAERDFMGVLRDVLPKAALKNAGADK
jgi:type VI secretion system protein ImpA